MALENALRKLKDATPEIDPRDLSHELRNSKWCETVTVTGLDGVSQYPVQLDENGQIVFDGRPWQIQGMAVPGAN